MVKATPKKVLVTGGAGFIGGHLVDLLVARGHPVQVVDLRPCHRPGAESRQWDLRRTLPPQMLQEVAAVYHLAWSTIPATGDLDPAGDISDNLLSSVQLLESCSAAGVPKVIFMSTGGTIYGAPRQIPIPEDHPLEPRCSYGITKLAVEKYLEFFRRTRGLEYVILRGANPFGEGQDVLRPLGAVGVFLHRLLEDRLIEIWGDGRVVRDYFYVRDLAQALYKALTYQPPENGSRIFNVGSGRGLSLLDLLGVLEEVTGRTPRVQFHPGRSLDVPVNILDCRRIDAALGWRPETDLSEGVRCTWRWLQESSRS
jgi:UDP-glucose 4-epimerase